MTLTRKQRQQVYREHYEHVRTLPETLTIVPDSEFPSVTPRPIKCWRSRHFVVQLFDEQSRDYPGLLRMSINRTTRKQTLEWDDNITWDELRSIKCELGYGDWYAVEVYPREGDIENVANMRHLWLLKEPLAIGWMNGA